jgi:hypothetical protein
MHELSIVARGVAHSTVTGRTDIPASMARVRLRTSSYWRAATHVNIQGPEPCRHWDVMPLPVVRLAVLIRTPICGDSGLVFITWRYLQLVMVANMGR